jgi:hypothetical protein
MKKGGAELLSGAPPHGILTIDIYKAFRYSCTQPRFIPPLEIDHERRPRPNGLSRSHLPILRQANPVDLNVREKRNVSQAR